MSRNKPYQSNSLKRKYHRKFESLPNGSTVYTASSHYPNIAKVEKAYGKIIEYNGISRMVHPENYMYVHPKKVNNQLKTQARKAQERVFRKKLRQTPFRKLPTNLQNRITENAVPKRSASTRNNTYANASDRMYEAGSDYLKKRIKTMNKSNLMNIILNRYLPKKHKTSKSFESVAFRKGFRNALKKQNIHFK